ncbi:MAG: permease [Evtepia sp.]|jgi:V/A-type H+-transporting ATPase subunit K|nr:permease [Evtepia sp.]
MEWMTLCGTAIGVLGASLAVGLACSGSAKGVGICGEVGATVLTEDPGKFSQVLILQIIPGTQGLYGLVVWFFALMKLGFFSGDLMNLSIQGGLLFASACLPIGIGGLLSAIAQGRCAAAGIAMCSKRPEEMSKGIIMAIMVEFYAILCLLASFLMINGLPYATLTM